KCIEHGLQIEGRAADNLEHIGGGCLLLERFTQLIKQTRVFDSDDGLRSEVLDQLDLLFSEGTKFLSVNGYYSPLFLVLEHRNAEKRPNAGDIDRGNRQRLTVAIGLIVSQVGNLKRLSGLCRARHEDVRIEPRHHSTTPLLRERRGQRAMKRSVPKRVPLAQPHRAVTGVADAGRVAQHGLENGLQLAR